LLKKGGNLGPRYGGKWTTHELGKAKKGGGGEVKYFHGPPHLAKSGNKNKKKNGLRGGQPVRNGVHDSKLTRGEGVVDLLGARLSRKRMGERRKTESHGANTNA